MFLTDTSTVNMPIDSLLFDLRVSRVARELRPLQVVPGLTTQCPEQAESDVQAIRENHCAWRHGDGLERALPLMPYEASINTCQCVDSVGWVDFRYFYFVKGGGSN